MSIEATSCTPRAFSRKLFSGKSSGNRRRLSDDSVICQLRVSGPASTGVGDRPATRRLRRRKFGGAEPHSPAAAGVSPRRRPCRQLQLPLPILTRTLICHGLMPRAPSRASESLSQLGPQLAGTPGRLPGRTCRPGRAGKIETSESPAARTIRLSVQMCPLVCLCRDHWQHTLTAMYMYNIMYMYTHGRPATIAAAPA
jgi:hypothetical protein